MTSVSKDDYHIETVDVQGSPMEVFIFQPTGELPRAGLLLCQHLPVAHAGIETDPYQLDTAARFASAGYAVVLPFMFHWWGKSVDMQTKRDEWRDDRAVADMNAGLAVLRGLPAVDAGRLGIVGHCWGGRMAWLGAATNPAYRACAVFYGGRIKQAMGAGTPPPIDLARDMRCALAGFFGNEDQNPTPADVNDYEAALKAAAVHYTFHRYDGAGHGFQTFTDAERYHQQASDDAWDKVLRFFDDTLGQPVAAAGT
jgi:carboxymethylenebutenolidase